jgi:hypothetical protein
MADAPASNAGAWKGMWVRLPPRLQARHKAGSSVTKHFSFTYRDDGTKHGSVILNLSENRWWWDAPVHLADLLCALTRHNWCNTIVTPAYMLAEKHTYRKLEVYVDRVSWMKWADMVGEDDPSWWWMDKP